ncbi:hypothetical protein RJG79_08435 [Mycoplasmatota bacterium WC44]
MKKRILIVLTLIIIIIVTLFFSFTSKLIEDKPTRYFKVRTITICDEKTNEEIEVSLWKVIELFISHDDIALGYKGDNYYVAQTSHPGEYKIVYDGEAYQVFDLLRLGYLQLEDLEKLKYPIHVEYFELD